MLLSLMIYVVTVSLLLAAAAWAFERAVRVFAFPTRWIWVVAMTASLGYTLVAILLPPAAALSPGAAAATPLDALLSPVIGSITQFADPTPAGVSLDTLLGASWAVLTLMVVAVLLRAHLRLRADRLSWTQQELEGREVLVSEDLGPGVVGWIQSAIVMPRWAFGMSPQEQELMLRHEAEHCRAGDTRVAGAALLLLTLLPWNLPLLWQVHRLRLAIEIDCDHRVLHRSADVKRYARLLVEIGARGTASRLSALAFARPIPSIERRILAMTDTRDAPRYMRTVGLALLAALPVVASCEVEQPPMAPASPAAGDADAPIVQVEPQPSQQGPTADPEETAVQAADVEAIEAELRALRAARAADQSGDVVPAQVEPQEIRPQDAAAIQAGPVFTPMTVRPEIRNRPGVVAALMTEYPAMLRDAAIEGTVQLWLYISETGQVLDSRVSKSSGRVEFDQAALRVAAVFRFTPAMNRDEPTQVWIQVPITFQVR